jgi:hypothetical protein
VLVDVDGFVCLLHVYRNLLMLMGLFACFMFIGICDPEKGANRKAKMKKGANKTEIGTEPSSS